MHIAIVGAGLAGLSAARHFKDNGNEVSVFERADAVGGRVRTDVVDGHRLDRGFQILLAAYPEAQNILDYEALDLRSFNPGAIVMQGSNRSRVSDPFRDPARLVETIRAPIGSLSDKARMLAFRTKVSKGEIDSLWKRPDMTAMERLQLAGFSSSMISKFLQPLFAGITLDPELAGSSRDLEFVFRMLSAGDAVVPALGMGEISNQLAAGLPDDSIHLNTTVASTSANEVRLDDGQAIAADAVVVATGVTDAAALAGVDDRGWRSVTSVWFRADKAPIDDKTLVLSGEGLAPVNSLAVMSNVSAAYAPTGSATIVASCPEMRPGLPDEMQRQLRTWFGPEVDRWDQLRVDEIAMAQPIHGPNHNRFGVNKTESGVWVCGDHMQDASINGALASGRKTAESVLAAMPV